LVAPPSYDSSNTQALYPFDIEQAAALLDESGWIDSDGDGLREKDGQPLELVFLTSISPVRQGTQELIKASLESIGFSVELKSVDSSIFLGPPEESTNTRRHFYADLEEFAFSNKSPDPTAYMKGWTCGEIAQLANNWSLSNWARYCNPAYDALYEQVAKEIDPEKRRQLFIQMNDLLIEDVALIPLVHFADVSVINSSLTGLDVTPWDVEVWNIMDWRMD
jgi:peptide/nickel transport system substrate-binding protein